LSQPYESLSCHTPFQRSIEHSRGNMNWHNLVPPSCLHELDFMIRYEIMHVLDHDPFVLDLYLFWIMMKHMGRCLGTILGWFY
jgi:hypothetical protein